MPGPIAQLPPLHALDLPEPAPPRSATLRDGSAAWVVTRYHEVRQVLTDPRFVRDLEPGGGGALNVSTDPASLYNQNGSGHQRLRRTAQGAFTPRAVAHWRPWVEAEAELLLDGLVAAGPPADLVADLTSVLPFAVAERLLGVDRLEPGWLQRWAACVTVDASDSEGQVASEQREFARFAAELLAGRRGRPGEDLASRLVQAADRLGGIPEEQLTYLLGGLVASGSDSVAGTLANALLYLLGERPESWPRLAEAERARLATEWLLHHIPLGDDEFTTRRAVEAVEVGDVRIPGGATVAVCLGSANRDPAVFPDGLSGDLFAPLPAPTLAFGAGPHHCLGTWLARTQLQVVLQRLAARLPGLRLAGPGAAVEWRLGSTTRSPRVLRVEW
ncbi:cytochrome P450 [Kitasatospora sp. NPDC059673]|uniref:cytochrome P450 n=1 Tax=Kitasatospora sp. NPDC059673 TaxID=3346901 RepID=UPI0036980F13